MDKQIKDLEDRIAELEKRIDYQSEEKFTKLEGKIKDLDERRVNQVMIMPRAVKRRHLEDKVVVFGDGDLPADDTSGISVHFDTGTGVFSMWDGSAWLDTTLS